MTSKTRSVVGLNVIGSAFGVLLDHRLRSRPLKTLFQQPARPPHAPGECFEVTARSLPK